MPTSIWDIARYTDARYRDPIVREFLPLLEMANDAFIGRTAWIKPAYGVSAEQLIDQDKAPFYLSRSGAESITDWRNRAISHLSQFCNYVQPAILGFTGLLTDYEILPETPASFQEAIDDITLDGRSLKVLIQELIKRYLLDGFVGVFADVFEGRDLPYFTVAERRSLINFSYDNAQNLNRITVVRKSELQTDDFVKQDVNLYCVIGIGEGVFYQEIDGELDSGKVMPIEGHSGLLDRIPVTFFGVDSSYPWSTQLPLFSIIESNFAHYNLLSAYRYNLALTQGNIAVRIGAIQPGESGNNLQPIRTGGQWGQDLPIGGDFKFVAPDASSHIPTAQELLRIEQFMLDRTLQFLQGGFNITATEATLRSAQTKASLNEMANVIEESVRSMIRNWCLFTGEEPDGGIAINRDSLNIPITDREFAEFKDAYLQGMLSYEDFWRIVEGRGGLPAGVKSQEIIESEAVTNDREIPTDQSAEEPETIDQKNDG